jgi:uncharacterized membrane protein YfcA
MPSLEPLPLVVTTLAFLLAGFVKGVIGLGLPTISMGLLSVVVPPAKAASLLIVPSFVTNVWQLAAGPSFRRLAYRLWPMLGAWFSARLPEQDCWREATRDKRRSGLGFCSCFTPASASRRCASL